MQSRGVLEPPLHPQFFGERGARCIRVGCALLVASPGSRGCSGPALGVSVGEHTHPPDSEWGNFFGVMSLPGVGAQRCGGKTPEVRSEGEQGSRVGVRYFFPTSGFLKAGRFWGAVG